MKALGCLEKIYNLFLPKVTFDSSVRAWLIIRTHDWGVKSHPTEK